jgi:hypothetical protein
LQQLGDRLARRPQAKLLCGPTLGETATDALTFRLHGSPPTVCLLRAVSSPRRLWRSMNVSGSLCPVSQPSPVSGEFRVCGVRLTAPQLGDHSVALLRGCQRRRRLLRHAFGFYPVHRSPVSDVSKSIIRPRHDI